MIIGERSYNMNPTVQIPPWTIIEDPTVTNVEDYEADLDLDLDLGLDLDEVYGSDHFKMFEFKVRKCTRGRSHDWTECPFVHPGEKARRRDPMKFHYTGTACPEFRKGNCKKGDLCEFGHGVFECWLHPSRYRTQPCKDGLDCHRRVCFFAHTPEQLRVLSPRTSDRFPFSPESISLSSISSSPPSLSVITHSLRQLQLSKVKSMPSSWGAQMSPPGYGSPRFSTSQPGFFSLPTTPTGVVNRVKIRPFDLFEEEPMLERVESGRNLRAKMFEKLSRDNFLGQVNPELQPAGPDVGWVSDLLN